MTTQGSVCRGVSSALAMLGVAAAYGQPTTVIYVDDDAAPGGDGARWDTAYQSPREALARTSGQAGWFEIRIAQGTYTPAPPGGDRTTCFLLTGATGWSAPELRVTVCGGYAGRGWTDPDARDVERWPTVLSGDLNGDDGPGGANTQDNSQAVLVIADVREILLDGLTISGGVRPASAPRGRAPGLTVTFHPSARYNERMTLSGCRVSDNTTALADGTAGVLAMADFCVFTDTVLERNRSLSGSAGAGGVEVAWASEASFSGCRIADNRGAVAGGILTDTTLVLDRCVIAGNESAGSGGGVASGGRTTVVNCLFASNKAAAIGGAISGRGVSATNCTFVGNSAPDASAVAAYAETLWLTNCILWGNPHGGTGFPAVVYGGGAQLSGNDVQGGPASIGGRPDWITWEGYGNGDFDPLFRDPTGADGNPASWRDNDYRLTANSRAVNASESWTAPASENDLGGLPRLVDFAFSSVPRVDMGPYEVQQLPCPGDVNKDGFVDGIDAELFPPLFESADPAADMNGDSYVDGMDYDLFMLAFELGC